jgi:hypothetical protein
VALLAVATCLALGKCLVTRRGQGRTVPAMRLLVAVPLLGVVVLAASFTSTAMRQDRFVLDASGRAPAAPLVAAATVPATVEAPADAPGAPRAGAAAPAAAAQAQQEAPAGQPAATPPAASSPAAASAPATAGRALAAHQEPRPSEPGMTWNIAVRTLGSIVAVVALIIACARFWQRLAGGARFAGAAGGTIRVVETAYLPAPNGRGRAAVHLMEIGGQRLLVGATDAQLSFLGEVEDPADALREPSELAAFDALPVPPAAPIAPAAPVPPAAPAVAVPAAEAIPAAPAIPVVPPALQAQPPLDARPPALATPPEVAVEEASPAPAALTERDRPERAPLDFAAALAARAAQAAPEPATMLDADEIVQRLQRIEQRYRARRGGAAYAAEAKSDRPAPPAPVAPLTRLAQLAQLAVEK